MRVVVIALLLLPLSGCVGDDADDLSIDTLPVGDVGEPGPSVPQWQVGDHWSFDTSFGTSFTLVVTSDAAGDYMVGTDSPGMAFFDELTDHSFIGPIGKGHLDGAQHGQRVKYFDFPLAVGKTWTTTLDGEALAGEVVSGSGERFDIVLRAGDIERVRYTYDNATRWFGEIGYYDDNGTETVSMRTVGSGRGYTGEVVTVESEVVADASIRGPTAGSGGLDLPAEGETDLYLISSVSCATGVVAFGIARVDDGSVVNGDGYGYAGPCPFAEPFMGVIATGPFEGEWGHSHASASPEFAWDFTLYLRTIHRTTLG